MGACASSGVNNAIKLECIRASPFYIHMGEGELDAFAKAFDAFKFKKGDLLPASAFYYLVEGELAVTVASEPDHVLATYKEGSFFSRYVGITNASTRKNSYTTAKSFDAEQPTILTAKANGLALVLPHKNLKSFTEKAPACAAIIDSMMESNVVDYLSKLPFLQGCGLSAADYRTLSELCHFDARPAESKIFEEGATGDAFYLILHGGVDVTVDATKYEGSFKNRSPEGTVKVAHITTGYYFGELALMVQMPRAASVTTTERTLLLSINKENFERFQKIAPAVADSLLSHTKCRMVEKLKNVGIPFFAEAVKHSEKEEDIIEMANLADIQQFPAETMVCKEGDAGKGFYVIVHGSVKVRSAALGPRGPTLHPGGYFGEVSLVLPDTACTASCVCETHCVMLTWDKAS